MTKPFRTVTVLIVSCFALQTGNAAENLEDLQVFSELKAPMAIWEIEGLTAGKKRVPENGGVTKMCLDIRKRTTMGRNVFDGSCDFAALSESPAEAMLELQCKNKDQLVVAITRNDDQSFTVDRKVKKGKRLEPIDATRYLYRGECTGEPVVYVDKSHPACQPQGAQRPQDRINGNHVMCAGEPKEKLEACNARMDEFSRMADTMRKKSVVCE